MGIFNIFKNSKKADSFNDAIKSQLLPEDKQNIEQLVQKEVVIEKTLQEQKSEIERRIMAIQRSTSVSIRAFARWHNDLRTKYRWYYKWHVNPLSSFVHWMTLSSYTASIAVFILSYLFTTAVVQIYAASAQTWGGSSGWEDWQLENASLTNNVLKLSLNEDQTYASAGSATLAFAAPNNEVVDWLSSDSEELLSGATVEKQYSTDNILFSDNIASLADSSNIYIKVNLQTSDPSVSPILNSLSIHYSQLPYSPDSPSFQIDKSILGVKQILKGGAFADPDGDQHKASQWQVAKSSGDYADAFLNTGSIESDDPADLTSYVLPHALDPGTYYLRVRYQDTTGAWGLWSKESAFQIESEKIALNIGTDTSEVLVNQNEVIAQRTETTKTIDNKDGTKTLESYSGLIHYKDDYADPSPEAWKDINPNHSVDNPEYVLFDQMPSTVKVFKDKIGYEIESRKTGDKYTVELESLDGTPKLSTNSAISNKQLAISNGSNRLVSWADINPPQADNSALSSQDSKLFSWLLPKAFATDSTNYQPQTTDFSDGNLKFEFEISEYGVRLWKTITGPDAPKNFTWNITKENGIKDASIDDLKFRENPEAFEINSSTSDTPTPVAIQTKKSEVSDTNNSALSSNNSTPAESFTWKETAPTTDLKIDTDVTYYSGAGDGYVTETYTGGTSYAIAHAATAGTAADYTGTTAIASSYKGTGTPVSTSTINRSFLPFDSSALPDAATISAATLSIYATAKTDGTNGDTYDYINVVGPTTQASSASLITEDFDQDSTVTSPTEGASDMDVTGITTSAYNAFTLDSDGIGWISKTGTTLLGVRDGHDIDFISPASGATNSVTYSTSEETGTTQDPKLAITYSAGGIDISGTSDQSSGTVSVAVNGSIAAQTTTAAATWTISGVTVNSGETVVVFIDGVADANEATAVTQYDGTGNISGMVLNAGTLSIGSADNQSFTNTEFGSYDSVDDEDILFTLSGTALTSIGTLSILASNTYAPDGSTSVSGSWSNAGTYTNGSQTITFTATATGKTIADGGSNWNNVTFNGSGGGWSFSDATIISGDLTVTTGTLSGTNDITVNGGDTTGNGTITLTGGTFLLDTTGNFGGNTSWTFYNLNFGDGSGATTSTKTAGSTGNVTVSNILTIATSQTLSAGSTASNWTLSGTTGTPFVKNGTFTASGSTFIYSGDYGAGNTTIVATTYNKLQINNASETYTIGSGTVTVSSDLTVTAGTLIGTGTINAHGNVTGDGTINLTDGTFTTNISCNFGGNTAWTFYSLWFGDQEGYGGVAVAATGSGGITASGVLTIDSGVTLNAAAKTWTLSGAVATPFAKSGTFTPSTSTFIYSGNYASGNTNVTSTTFWNLQTNNAAETYAAAGALDVNGSLTLTTGTLSMGAYNLNVAGDFLNPGGTFTKGTGSTAVILDGAGATIQTISGSNEFNNLTATAAAARTLKFTAGTTQTVTGTWTATGVAGQLLTLTSTTTNAWTINPTAATVSYADISYSTNTGVAFCATYSQSTSNGNTGWSISSGSGCTPTAPSGVSIDTAATDGFTAHWTDNSSNETGFKVYVSTTPTSGNPTPCDATATYSLYTTTAAGATSQAVTGQSVNLQYCAKVAATNAGGDSADAYAAAPLYTLANVPSAPTVNATSTTSLTAIINVNSNPSNTTYAIYNDTAAQYVAANGTLTASAVWQSYTTWGGASGIANTGLSVNTQYTYTVKARNGDNTETAFSSSASKYTLANVPSAPTVNATSTTSLTVIVNVNSNPAGTEFAISCDSDTTFLNYTTNACEAIANDADHWRTYANWGGASGFVDTGLSVNTTHTYKAEARNGDSTATALSSGTSKYTIANTPALTSVAGDYDTSDLYHLDVTINANGNPAGTNYYLQYSTNDTDYLDPNAMDWQTAGTYIFKKTSANADLAGNTQYWIKVQAKNGDGTATGYSGSSPDVTPPAAPGSLNSSNLCRTTASTSWGAATGADTYTFSYGTDVSATNLGTTAGIAVTSKDLTGLTNSTTYYFKVSGTSTANGTGAYSSIASFATTSCTAPTAPSDFAGSPASTTQINWSWTDTADDETAWNVHNTSHSSVSGALAAGTTSYNETLLSLNTAYTRHANVSNGNGNNDSNQVTVYTLANAPSAPTVAAASSSSITVTVNKNSNPEATTRYAIAVSSDGGATWSYVKNSDGTTQVAEDWQLYADWGGASGFANTGLTAAKEYTYKVKAKNGDSVATAFSATAAATSSNPTIQFTSSTASGAESTTAVNIAVSIGNASATDSSVAYAVTGGTATGSGTDYTLASGTATITAGQTSANIAMTVVNDTLDEVDETVIVTVSTPTNATLGSNTTHTYTISDNDDAPTVAFTSATGSGAESSSPVNLEVSLSTASGKTITVDYVATGGTATGSGTDYTLVSGTSTITAGSTTANIALTVVNDTLDENDETVVVTLSNPSNASLGANTTNTYTILDDDTSPTVAFSATSSTGSESATPANLELTLSAVSGRDVTAAYAVSGGTATGSGTDYTLASGTATIAAGSTTTNVALSIVDDALDEDDETVIVTISSPGNATLGANTVHTYTITDNDDAPTVTLSQNNVTIAEAGGTSTVTATLSSASSREITVNLAYAGTATVTSDYTSSASAITIAAGGTTGTATLTGVNDNLVEIDETVITSITTASNATESGTQELTTTITSEDVPPTGTISINSDAAKANSLTLTLTLTTTTAAQVLLSDSALFSGATYATYANSMSFTLSAAADGVRTVYAKFKDAYGNESISYSDTITIDLTAPSAPSNLTAVSGNTSISLAWTNPTESDFANIAIFRSTTASFTPDIAANKIASTTLAATATYTDTAVTNGVAYYYKLKAIDATDNYSVASSEVSGKADNDNPTTPGAPTISGKIADKDGKELINSKSVTLTWAASTDPSSGLKGYYITIGTTSGGSDIVAAKEVLVSSLANASLPSTLYSLPSDNTYYVRIQTKDNLGNASAYSGELALVSDSIAPAVSAEALMYDASNRAEGFYVVALTFKSSSDDGAGLKGYIISKNGSQILDNADKTLTDKIASDSASGYSSYLDLSSADASSSYTIKAVDFAGNTTGEETAKLADTQIAKLTGQIAGSTQIKLDSTIIGEGELNISDIVALPSSLVGKKTQAKITWKTTVPSSTQVEYGQSSEYAFKTELDKGLNSTHTAILSELLPATTYHYRVKSTDKYGTEVASADQTFTANQIVQDKSVLELIIDNLAEVLSGLWSNMKGIFSVNPDYSLAADSKTVSKLSVANISTDQKPAYIAYWPKEKGNVKVERSENGTTFSMIAETGQNYYVDFSAKAKIDCTYRVNGESAVITEESGGKAVISGIESEAGLTSLEEASAIITFHTDTLAKSQVFYGESASYGTETELADALNQSHTVLIEQLKPKTLYHFKVKTTDKSGGNVSEGEDNTFVTADPPVDVTLMQVIIRALSDAFSGFGSWISS